MPDLKFLLHNIVERVNHQNVSFNLLMMVLVLYHMLDLAGAWSKP